MASVVTAKCVKSSINGKVRRLRKADKKPGIYIGGEKPALCVTRHGNLELLPISRRLAEELIAAGFSFGN